MGVLVTYLAKLQPSLQVKWDEALERNPKLVGILSPWQKGIPYDGMNSCDVYRKIIFFDYAWENQCQKDNCLAQVLYISLTPVEGIPPIFFVPSLVYNSSFDDANLRKIAQVRTIIRTDSAESYVKLKLGLRFAVSTHDAMSFIDRETEARWLLLTDNNMKVDKYTV